MLLKIKYIKKNKINKYAVTLEENSNIFVSSGKKYGCVGIFFIVTVIVNSQLNVFRTIGPLICTFAAILMQPWIILYTYYYLKKGLTSNNSSKIHVLYKNS